MLFRSLRLMHCFRLASAARLGGVLVAAACGTSNYALAAPVTFRFEATVGSVFPQSAGATLPFSVTPGDTLTGRFTFDAGDSGPVYPQSSSIHFDILGVALEVPSFEITVADNANIGVDLAGRIADPNNTPDVDLGGASDNIILSSSTTLFGGVVPGHGNLSFRPLLAFAHESTLLNSDDLIANVNIWNTFSFREMSLIFRDANSGSETYVGAYLGSLSQVPEPTMLALGSVLFAFVHRPQGFTRKLWK